MSVRSRSCARRCASSPAILTGPSSRKVPSAEMSAGAHQNGYAEPEVIPPASSPKKLRPVAALDLALRVLDDELNHIAAGLCAVADTVDVPIGRRLRPIG